MHPAVIDSYRDGTLIRALGKDFGSQKREVSNRLRLEEAAVLALLERMERAGENLEKSLRQSLQRMKQR